jgi:hypothetical protein
MEFITQNQFLTQMNRLATTWKDINTAERTPRYFLAVKDLPNEAVKEIINNLLDSASKMPLPKDFQGLASEWRKNFFLKNGHYYGTEKDAVSDINSIDCKTCFDCGILKIKHHQPDAFKQLMLCDCEAGTRSTALMPQWDSSVSGAFVKLAIDPTWFNPHASEQETLEESEKKVFKKVMEWKKIVKKSEIYWKDLGFIRKDS